MELLRVGRTPEPGMQPEATPRAGVGCAVRPRVSRRAYLARMAPGGSCGSLVVRGSPGRGRARLREPRRRRSRGGGGEVPGRRDSSEGLALASGLRGGLGRGGARVRAGPGLRQRARGGRSASTGRGRVGARLGAEREREAGSSPGWGVEDPGRNFTLGESQAERRGLGEAEANVGGACSKGRGQCQAGASRGRVWSCGGRQCLAKAGPGFRGRSIMEGRGQESSGWLREAAWRTGASTARVQFPPTLLLVFLLKNAS